MKQKRQRGAMAVTHKPCTSYTPRSGSRPLNCWEFMECGREPGGRHADELGVCVAAVDSRLDGIHRGTNAGRSCWVAAGTFCEGRVQGTFAQKFVNCQHCPFYKLVHKEEGPGAKQSDALLLYLSSSEAAERRRYCEILAHLMDPAVAPLALDNLDALKQGEVKHVTALFSDIASSSLISEKLRNSEMTAFLNEYFSAMADILKAEGGTLDKYVGDEVIGIFGAPRALENDGRAAARAAVRMQERLGELRSEWKRRRAWCPEVWSLRIRIGLNSGPANVGFFGTRDLMTYSMVGQTVNVAKRLEQACVRFGVPILVGEATRELIADEMVLRRLGRVRLKGKRESQVIYELLGEKDRVPAQLVQAAEAFEAADELYDHRRWAEAAVLFREAVRFRSDDVSAARLWRRCERRLAGSSLRS